MMRILPGVARFGTRPKFLKKNFLEKFLNPITVKGSGAKTDKSWTRCINETPKAAAY
jgi:hypothetical protein